MTKLKSLFLFFFFWMTGYLAAQPVLSVNVSAGEYTRKDCPVFIDLTSMGLPLNNEAYQLVQSDQDGRIPIKSQLEQGSRTGIWFILEKELKKGESREFLLEPKIEDSDSPGITIEKTHEGLKLVDDGKPILNYQFEEVFPPDGVDPIYKRSGFIHPLWSPGGEILTRIQPSDHFHHYGIWGPWTKTHIKGREVDFWNLVKGEGTVRFANFISENEGPVFSGFSVLQQHIDFGTKGEDQIAINETLEVNVWNISKDDNVRLIEYQSTMSCPLDSGILLDAYRYGGGIGYRATERWTKSNSSILTSEGNDRMTADGTNARWCIVEGESSAGRSGILFMDFPSNRRFPQPMRVWPVDANNGRGDVYFEFCPIRHQPWPLEKGKKYAQKYRLLVFDGELSAEKAERYWSDFAYPPTVTIHKLPNDKLKQ